MLQLLVQKDHKPPVQSCEQDAGKQPDKQHIYIKEHLIEILYGLAFLIIIKNTTN